MLFDILLPSILLYSFALDFILGLRRGEIGQEKDHSEIIKVDQDKC